MKKVVKGCVSFKTCGGNLEQTRAPLAGQLPADLPRPGAAAGRTRGESSGGRWTILVDGTPRTGPERESAAATVAPCRRGRSVL